MNVTVAKKIWGLLLTGMIGLVLMAVLAVVDLRNLAIHQDEGAQRARDAVVASENALMGAKIYQVVADAVINRKLDKTRADWSRLTAEIKEDAKAMAALADTDEERREVARGNEAMMRMVQVFENEMLPLLSAKDDNWTKIREIDDQLDSEAEIIEETFGKVARSMQKEAKDADTEFDLLSQRTIAVSVAIGAVIAVLLMVFGVVIIRSITRPLGRLQTALAGIEKSRDLSIRVAIDQQDEIGQTARALNSMLDGVSTAMTGVMANVRQVAVATSQASTAVGQVSDGAQNQLNALKQISVGVEQTARAVQEVSANAQVSSGHAREAAGLVRSGRQSMEGLVEVVGLIAGNSEQITKITQVISQIANQTNMLSLNAAIEAARAGEHGKGFAVVAEEVGRLADHSGRSVQEIVALVERAVKETQRGVEMTRAVNGSIERIAGGVAESDRMAGAIAAAMEQQQSAVVEIRANVGDLTRIGEANASAAEEITATMVELSRLTQQTREAVETFRLA